MLISVSDPAWLFRFTNASMMRGIHMEPLEFGEDLHAVRSGSGNDYLDRGIQFFSFLTLSQTLEASRFLAFASDEIPGALGRQQTSVECPSWISNLATQSSTRVLEDSFVVPDLEELEEEPKRPQLRRKTAPRRHARPIRRDYSHMYEVIRELDGLSKEDAVEVIAELRKDIASMDPDDCCQNTL